MTQQQVLERRSQEQTSMALFDKVSLFSYKMFRKARGTTREEHAAVAGRPSEVKHAGDPRRAHLCRVPCDPLSTIAVLGVVALVLVARLTPFLLLAGDSSPPFVFIMMLNTPKASASSRASAVDNELPLVVGYMSILAGGGISLIDTLRRIADLSIFPAAAKEAKRILLDIDAFGCDPLTALDRGAKNTPSRPLSDLLSGYTTVLRTGGDYVNFLNINLKESFEARAAKMKRPSRPPAPSAESFLIITVDARRSPLHSLPCGDAHRQQRERTDEHLLVLVRHRAFPLCRVLLG